MLIRNKMPPNAQHFVCETNAFSRFIVLFRFWNRNSVIFVCSWLFFGTSKYDKETYHIQYILYIYILSLLRMLFQFPDDCPLPQMCSNGFQVNKNAMDSQPTASEDGIGRQQRTRTLMMCYSVNGELSLTFTALRAGSSELDWNWKHELLVDRSTRESIPAYVYDVYDVYMFGLARLECMPCNANTARHNNKVRDRYSNIYSNSNWVKMCTFFVCDNNVVCLHCASEEETRCRRRRQM